MKKFWSTLLMIFLIGVTVSGAVKTYEGTDEYYVLGAVENINVARERARERALRDAQEKAGVYIHTMSKVTNMKMLDDEIISVASGVLRVLDTSYEIVQLTDLDGYLIRATVKADIDSGDVEKFLEKDTEEISKIIDKERAARQQAKQLDQKIDTLKKEYRKATTTTEKENIAKQIVEEDNVFLSNVKLREGNKYLDDGDPKTAEKLFTEAVELDPENFLAWHNRAWAYIDQKKYKQAMEDLNKATALSPNSEYPYFGRGWVYEQQKNFEAAIREYDKVIDINPRYYIAWNNRGASKSWLNRMQEAVVDYDKAIELNPKYVRAYENRAKAYIALGNDRKARLDFAAAAELNHSNKNVDKAISEALALNEKGEYIKALEILNDAAELFPDNQMVFVNRGNIYNNYIRDFEAAIADYNRTIEINPQFSWPYLNRAIAQGRMKNWEEGIADCVRALSLDPNYASAYNQRAWLYCKVGKFEEAVFDANRALKLKPNEANYFDTRAEAYAGLKRYAEAVDDMNKAIKLSPQGWLFHNRGKIYQQMGEAEKAKADFAKARKLAYNG